MVLPSLWGSQSIKQNRSSSPSIVEGQDRHQGWLINQPLAINRIMFMEEGAEVAVEEFVALVEDKKGTSHRKEEDHLQCATVHFQMNAVSF